MAFQRKPGPAQTIAIVGQIPQPPKLPEQMVDRFPELKAYQDAMTSWWDRFSDKLQRDLDQISTQFDADQTAIQTLQAQVAALQA